MDPRALMRQGDARLEDGDTHAALRDYEEAARGYMSEGFSLKAIAIWKQMRETIQRHPRGASELAAIDAQARQELVQLYRGLGLESDALAVEAEGAGLGAGPTRPMGPG